jgi:hypothetical protein
VLSSWLNVCINRDFTLPRHLAFTGHLVLDEEKNLSIDANVIIYEYDFRENHMLCAANLKARQKVVKRHAS